MNIIQRYIFAYRVRKTIKQANELRNMDGKRYMVLYIKGRPRVIAQANVKALIKRHVFPKGTSIDDIRRKALFITK